VQASGGYAVNKGSTFIPQVETRQWYVGFNVSLPLYSGGETSARIERAVAVESEQSYSVTAIREQINQKVRQAFLNLEYSGALVVSLKQKVSSASMQLDAVKMGLDGGTRTVIDLWTAEQGNVVAQRDLMSALYDNAQRRLELKFAAGVLYEADLTQLNSALVD
jgi:outer membrane protein